MNRAGAKPLRIKWAGRAPLLAALGLVGLTMTEPLQAAGQAEPLLRSTPLVLKDGRIASVSIHEVPFARGQAGLTAGAGAGLEELTREVGTDCFLTAQVIGHIDSSEIAEQDSLSAHRLARARADAVQGSLIAGGLPAKAIASVWDWQFMVREARATLWVFQLTAGEDCDGRPLRDDLVAQASTSQGPAATAENAAPAPVMPPEPARARGQGSAPAQAIAPAQAATEGATPPAAPESPAIVAAMAPAEPAPGRSMANTRRSDAMPQPQAQAMVPAEAAERAPAQAPAPTSRPDRDVAGTPGSNGAQAPGVTQPMPPPGPEATAAPAERQVAAVAPDSAPASSRPPQPAGTDGKVETGAEGALVITFATNSSYMPKGTSRKLQQLLARLEPGKRYEATLQVAVSGSRKVVGTKSAEEAARYNRWLAERRLERVQQWLLENAGPDRLTIAPSYRTDDESRELTLRLAPVG